MSVDAGTSAGTYLRQVRLTAFKSFHDQVLQLSPLAVMIGRNSSGKSNALDAIEVLSRLATGEDIRDALEGHRRDADPVRGGVEGCAPHGEGQFALGCSVATEDGLIDLDVIIQVRPDVRVVSEILVGPGDKYRRTLLKTVPQDTSNSDIWATLYGGRPGRNTSSFRPTRLLTSQLPLRLGGATAGERITRALAEQVLTVLRGVFQLDPVPHLMRQYVPERDSNLRRTAENLSAAVGRLLHEDPEGFQRLLKLLRGLADHEINKLSVTSSDLGDVMLALDEGSSGLTPAREMSDGMLRFLAICTAVLTGGGGLDIDSPDDRGVTRTLMLVIEDLENGLHPSQASTVFRLIKEASAERTTQVLVTTHSPALLSALDGSDHRSVIVCSRDRKTGQSRVRPLVDMEGYAVAMAAGTLGEVVTRNTLLGEPTARRDFTELDRLLGIG